MRVGNSGFTLRATRFPFLPPLARFHYPVTFHPWVPLAASAFALRRDKRGFASPTGKVLRRYRSFSIADIYTLGEQSVDLLFQSIKGLIQTTAPNKNRPSN